MPVITMFYGIIITMYWDDHLPPHFHASFGEYKDLFDLDGNIIDGDFPTDKRKLVDAWIVLHKEELAANWELARDKENVMPIAPLK
jgi:hypothetical protein